MITRLCFVSLKSATSESEFDDKMRVIAEQLWVEDEEVLDVESPDDLLMQIDAVLEEYADELRRRLANAGPCLGHFPVRVDVTARLAVLDALREELTDAQPHD